MAQLVNVIAPIFSNEKGLYLQTIYHPLQLFANNTKGKALELFVDSPKYKTRRFDDVPYIDVSAAYDNGSLVMNVVNRHQDQSIATEFEAEDKQFSGDVSVVEVNGPDIKSENDFGKNPVQTIARTATADPRKLRYTFPAHSYTLLKVKLG
jgi:alpha-N-arabinofuranosidase